MSLGPGYTGTGWAIQSDVADVTFRRYRFNGRVAIYEGSGTVRWQRSGSADFVPDPDRPEESSGPCTWNASGVAKVSEASLVYYTAPQGASRKGDYQLDVSYRAPTGVKTCPISRYKVGWDPTHFWYEVGRSPAGTTFAGSFTIDNETEKWNLTSLQVRVEACGSAPGTGRVEGARLASNVGSCPFPHRAFSHRFASCREMKAWAKKYKNGLPEAQTVWSVVGLPEYQGGGRWRMPYSLDKASYVAETDYSWPGMTEAEKTALNKTLADLLVHEHGHLTVAARYIAAHPSGSFRAPGNTRAGTAAGERVLKRYMRALDKREKLYDRITDHGRHQSRGPAAGFPGGNDVVFAGCS